MTYRTPTTISRSLIFVALLALPFSGCIQTQATKLNAADRTPVEAEAVQVFRTAEALTCAYEEVAIIHAQGDVNLTNEAQMIRKAQKEAAELGANGIILGGFKEPNAVISVASAILNFTPDRRGEMVAIYVLDACTHANSANTNTRD